MAKLIVAIEIDRMDKSALEQHIEQHKDDWFPLPDKKTICVDEADLTRDPTDNSFYAFEFRGVED